MEYTIERFETGPFTVNTWVFPLNKESIAIIDPGGVTDELLRYLKKYSPNHLEIMLTHGHFDHLGGLPALIKQYPDYRLWIHKADAAYLGTGAIETHSKCFTPFRVQGLIDSLDQEALPEPTDFFKEGDTINGFTVLHTPGHTQGSICLWNKEAHILFSGDTLFYGSRGRTDLFDGDEAQIYRSLNRLFNEIPEDTLVYPGHGSNTSIGFEKKFQGRFLN